MPEEWSSSAVIPEDFSLDIETNGDISIECQSPTKLVSEKCKLKGKALSLSKLKVEEFNAHLESIDCKGSLVASSFNLDLYKQPLTYLKVKHLGVASSG